MLLRARPEATPSDVAAAQAPCHPGRTLARHPARQLPDWQAALASALRGNDVLPSRPQFAHTARPPMASQPSSIDLSEVAVQRARFPFLMRLVGVTEPNHSILGWTALRDLN